MICNRNRQSTTAAFVFRILQQYTYAWFGSILNVDPDEDHGSEIRCVARWIRVTWKPAIGVAAAKAQLVPHTSRSTGPARRSGLTNPTVLGHRRFGLIVLKNSEFQMS